MLVHQADQSPLRRYAPWCSKEVDATALGEATPEPGHFGLQLRPAVFRDCTPGKLGCELPRSFADLSIVRISRRVEQPLHLLIAQAFDEARLAERRLAALLDDLPKRPLEVLSGVIGVRQGVDGVLDG